jgi:hypothetical protein
VVVCGAGGWREVNGRLVTERDYPGKLQQYEHDRRPHPDDAYHGPGCCESVATRRLLEMNGKTGDLHKSSLLSLTKLTLGRRVLRNLLPYGGIVCSSAPVQPKLLQIAGVFKVGVQACQDGAQSSLIGAFSLRI